jgi:hypothetical protein
MTWTVPDSSGSVSVRTPRTKRHGSA